MIATCSKGIYKEYPPCGIAVYCSFGNRLSCKLESLTIWMWVLKICKCTWNPYFDSMSYFSACLIFQGSLSFIIPFLFHQERNKSHSHVDHIADNGSSSNFIFLVGRSDVNLSELIISDRIIQNQIHKTQASILLCDADLNRQSNS